MHDLAKKLRDEAKGRPVTHIYVYPSGDVFAQIENYPNQPQDVHLGRLEEDANLLALFDCLEYEAELKA